MHRRSNIRKVHLPSRKDKQDGISKDKNLTLQIARASVYLKLILTRD